MQSTNHNNMEDSPNMPMILWRERNFEDQDQIMNELRIFLINTLFHWSSVIDFNGLSIHDFLASVVNNA